MAFSDSASTPPPPASTAVAVTAVAAPSRTRPIDRATKRRRERRARERRASNFTKMRETRDALELALLVAHTRDSEDAAWEDFLDPKAVRVRRFLRKSVQLAAEAAELQRERTLLVQLLEEHRLASHVFTDALEDHPLDDWPLNVARWRELARRRFKPWTVEECQVEIETSFKEMLAFQWSRDKETTGASLLGWREWRRLDINRGVFQYEFQKTFHGFDIMDSINTCWDMYTEVNTFQKVVTGHTRCAHDVLQQLGPNMVIARASEQFQALSATAHMAFLVFRVRTEAGGLIEFMRTICCPEVMDAINERTDLWMSLFSWAQWDPLPEREGNGYTHRLGGTLAGSDPDYLQHWMMGIFGSILRCERIVTKRQLLSCD